MVPLLFTAFIDMMGVGIVIPVLEPLFNSPDSPVMPVGVSQSTKLLLFGLLLASFPLMQFFGAPMLGMLSDRYGRKKLLLLSLCGTLLGFVLMAFGVMEHNLVLVFAGRIIDGFTGGNISIAMAAAADLSKPETRARNFGLIGMSIGLGFILGPFIGGELSNPDISPWFGKGTPFLAAATMCTINIVLLLAFFKETLRQPRQVKLTLAKGFQNVGVAFGDPRLRGIFVVLFLVVCGFTFFTQFMAVFTRAKFSWLPQHVGRFYAYIGIWIAVAQGLIVNLVTRKWSSPQILRVTMLTLGVSIMATLLLQQGWMMFACAPFVALSQGVMAPNLNATVSLQAPPERQGEIMGIAQSVNALGLSIAPLVSGLVSGLNVNLPTVIGGTLVLAAWAIFTFMLFARLRRTGLKPPSASH
jgi:DHA1 family tetracycline resistance protein-like MFS transporter